MCMLAPYLMQEGAGEMTEEVPRSPAAVRRTPLADANGESVCAVPVTAGVFAGISLAAAGDMRLTRENFLPWRSQLRDRIGVARDRLYGTRQVHSRRVLVVERQSAVEVASEEADGLLTVRDDAVLSVTVADCLPIWLADRANGAFGIVHSGWKGTGIVADAVRILRERFGCRPGDLVAVVGPGIGPCCYTVPPERAQIFRERYGAATVVGEAGQPGLDLRAANLVLLEEAGVRDVTVVTDCTSCSPRFGSFRRQGPGEFTLMLAWIGRAAAGGAP